MSSAFRMVLLGFVAVLGGSGLLSCSHGHSVVDQMNLRSREIEPLSEFQVRADDGFFEAHIQAASPPQALETDHQYDGFLIPLGTEVPLFCFVYRSSVDPAHALKKATDSILQKLGVWNLDQLDSGVVDGYPFLRVDFSYEKKDSKDSKVHIGQLKAITYVLPMAPVMCLHDEVGYGKSFETITAEFVRSLNFPKRPPESPAYKEVFVLKLKAKTIGFAQFMAFKKKGEKVFELNSSAYFMPVQTPSGVVTDTHAFDSMGSNLSSQGKQVQGEIVIRETGETTTSLQYQWTPKGYRVKGSVRGSRLDTLLKPAIQMESNLTKIVGVTSLSKGAKGPLTFFNYWPLKDRETLCEETIGSQGASIVSETRLNNTRLMEVLFELDSKNQVESTKAHVDGDEILSQLVYREGEL